MTLTSKEVTLLTPLAAEEIPDDIARLTSSINNVTLDNAGAAPSDVESTEEQLVNAYSNFTTALINYTNDLETKETILATLGEQAAIYNQLLDLRQAAYEFELFLEGLLEDPDPLNELLELGLEGAEAVIGADHFYQPE